MGLDWASLEHLSYRKLPCPADLDWTAMRVMSPPSPVASGKNATNSVHL
ncbi:zinc finger family protein [Corchorus olitorius]|uniref:Zinc finger family protein n=1 Tax=Corchorus olitorius TaxID=93759 RepID=A0A1R3L0M1_9ROSI|nr:zinc finger family protein [Corchorus olitorius]